MFSHTKAYNGFSVDDISLAKEFYSETLGLRLTEDHGMLTLHVEGERDTLIYHKQAHTPSSCTILNFPVANIVEAIEELAARGVPIERYEGLEQDENGIFLGGGPPIAWFKDPAGNTLSVVSSRTGEPSS